MKNEENYNHSSDPEMRERNMYEPYDPPRRNGMYLLIALVLVMLGVAAIFIFNAVNTPTTKEPAENPVIAPTSSPQQVQPSPTVQPTQTPAEEPESQTLKEQATQTIEEEKETMMKPLEGTILRPYSPEKPIYFESLNTWMVHTGVDIVAEKGTEIKASLSGTVESVENDPATGYTITIVSEDGITLVYANVATLELVEVGQEVKQGDTISTVGNSAAATKGDPDHLHLEYFKNGKRMDTKLYDETN